MLKTIQSAKNLLSSIAADAEVSSNGNDCEDKMVKRLPSKNLNKAIAYLTSDTRQAFTQLRETFMQAPIL